MIDYLLDKDEDDDELSDVPIKLLDLGEDSDGNSVTGGAFQNFSHNETNHEAVEMEIDSQPSLSSVLNKVIAHVEVRTQNENRSAGVENQLLALGASVSKTLSFNVTHLVFKDGSLATYKKAKRLGIHIVSISWIEACKKVRSRVVEADYPCSSKERYESPGLFPKLRKARSMQPKADEEDEKLMDLRVKRARRRREKKEMDEARTAPAKMKVVSRLPVPLDYFKTPSPKKKLERRKSVLDILQEYQENNIGGEMSSPCTSEELNTPLAKRLAFKLIRGNNGSSGSLPCSPLSNRKRDDGDRSPLLPNRKIDFEDNFSPVSFRRLSKVTDSPLSSRNQDKDPSVEALSDRKEDKDSDNVSDNNGHNNGSETSEASKQEGNKRKQVSYLIIC